MIIIPVIDLIQGRAVQARLGLRDTYRPLNSPLCRNGDVLPLVGRLTADFDCRLIYVADLDAIRTTGNNTRLLASIAAGFPNLDIWLDGGFRTPADIASARAHFDLRPVIGSETWSHPGELADPEAILSIDMDSKGLRDPSGICNDPGRRPRDAILMSLNRVGSRLGPDLDSLRQWQTKTPDTNLYAAGGVRDKRDLAKLHTAGAAGVLVASALHHGNLSPTDLERFS